MAILKQKMGETGVEIDPPALEMIAELVETNARELEGTFRRVTALADTREVPIDTDLVREFFGVERARKTRRVRPTSIIAKTAKYYDYKSSELKGQSRKAPLAMARHVAMYIIKKELDSPYEKIGSLFGGRDHTTIMHGVEKIDLALRANPQIKKDVSEIKRLVF